MIVRVHREDGEPRFLNFESLRYANRAQLIHARIPVHDERVLVLQLAQPPATSSSRRGWRLRPP